MKLRNPVPEILAALSALWSRISGAIGRRQAEEAYKQQSETDAMDAEIQVLTGTHETEPQATVPATVPVAVDGRS